LNVKHKFGDFALLYGAFVIYSFSSLCSKYAALQKFMSPKFILFTCGLVGFLALYALVWQQVLRRFTLVTAMSSKGVVVILSLLWSVLFFSEAVTAMNLVGAALIIVGIWVVSRDG